jgi:hypothetical protein
MNLSLYAISVQSHKPLATNFRQNRPGNIQLKCLNFMGPIRIRACASQIQSLQGRYLYQHIRRKSMFMIRPAGKAT